MSAASLVTIATGLSTGTTLVTYTALAAVVAGLALVRSFAGSLGAAFAAFVLATAFVLLITTFVLVAAFVHLLAAGHLLTTGARAFLTSTALSIRSAVASSIAATAILAGTKFLLGTGTVGLITALLGFLATFVLTAASGLGYCTFEALADNVNVLLNASLYHFANTLGSQSGTGDTIHFCFTLALAFLDDGECNLAIGHYGATDELTLEGFVLDKGSEASCFTLVIEESTKYLLTVECHGYITPDAAPQAAAFQRKHVCVSAFGSLSSVNRELLADLLGLNIESVSAFNFLTIGSQHKSLFNQFVVLGLYIALGNATNVERSQYLSALVDSHILVLLFLQGAADEGQQEGYEHHHHCCVADGVNITVCI